MNEYSLFLKAMEIEDRKNRAAFLDRECGGDLALRRQVDELLDAHDSSSGFLDVPALKQISEAGEPTGVFGTDATLKNESEVNLERDFGFLQPPEAPGAIGRLAHYDILAFIGRGGCGIVFKGFDRKLHRMVAIKVMAPELAVTSPARQRFLREARATAAIRHENVVHIYAVEEAPIPFLVMEFIDGDSLQQLIHDTGPLDLPLILRLGRMIAEGLEAAHRQGLIHRDIKPGNILIDSGTGQVKITDFGLARSADDANQSMTGAIAGTPLYMSPEQVRGERLDRRSDLFSLGSVLYVMCTGRAPFRAETTIAVLRRVADEDPRDIHEIIPETPAWLVLLIKQLHAKDPADRPASAQEVAQRLVDGPEEKTSGDKVEVARDSVLPSGALLSSPWLKVAAVVVLLLSLLGVGEATGVTSLGGTVIHLFSAEGTLVIEVDDPGVQVSIDGEEMVITGAGVKELRMKPGQYRLQASKDGEVLRQELVTVTRNGRQVLRISQEGIAAAKTPDTAIPSPTNVRPEGVDTIQEIDLEWTPVIAGVDLNQSFLKLGNDGWILEDGVLRNPTDGRLLTRDIYDSFILKFEFQITPDTSATIDLCASPKDTPVWVFLENTRRAMGAITWPTQDASSISVNRITPPPQLRDEGVWNDMTIELKNQALTVTLNDRVLDHRSLTDHLSNRRANDSPERRHLGQIGFSKRWGEGEIRLRNIKIKTLPSALNASPDRRAAEYVLSVGGKIQIDDQDRKITSIADLPNDPFRLTVVDLQSNRQVTEEGLAAFRGTTHLKYIRAAYTPGITDDSLAHFRENADLTLLDVFGAKISATGLKHFENCPALQNFLLNHTAIDDDAMKFFRDFVGLSRIRGIVVGGTTISDEGLANLQGAVNLMQLVIDETKITDEGLKVFANHKTLAWVSLQKTGIGDEGLIHLHNCRQIATIDLRRTQVTAAGIEAFSKALPKCRIDWDGGVIKPGQEIAAKPTDAVKFGGKYYKVFKEKLSWLEAKPKCEQINGMLAVIDSPEENRFVTDLVQKSDLAAAWLGATDEQEEGKWTWLTGEPLTYANWEPTQPNNKGDGEHYLTLIVGMNGQWTAQPSKSVEHEPGFVCQWDADEPSPDRVAAEYVLSVGGQVWVNKDSAFTDNYGIESLDKLPTEPFRLTHAKLTENGHVTDAGLAAFEGTKHLRGIYLTNSQNVGDQGIAHLRENMNLHEVHLWGTKVSGVGLDHFKKCGGIIDLYFGYTRVRDADMHFFRESASWFTLRCVMLTGLDITDEGIANLAGAPALGQIHLEHTKVTDAGLLRLAECPKLGMIVANGTPLTAEGIARFRELKPNCHVAWKPLSGAAPMQSTKTDPENPANQRQAFFDQMAKLPVGEQAAAVARKLAELNPGFDGKVSHKIAEGKVIDLQLAGDHIAEIWPVQALGSLTSLQVSGAQSTHGKLTDLSPLAGLPLTSLNISNSSVVDLSPLIGLKLVRLDCNHTKITDLSPLSEMPLKILNIWNGYMLSDLSPLKGLNLTHFTCDFSQVSDLTPLEGMPLEHLSIHGTRVADLSPLRDMPLKVLYCIQTRVADLTPLEGAPLTLLQIEHSPISDLTPLAGKPLKQLGIDETLVSDFSILADLPLEQLSLSMPLFHERDENLLFQSPIKRLKSIPWKADDTAAFWREFKARKEAAEAFAATHAGMSPEEQVQAILVKLRKGVAGIGLKPTVEEGRITAAELTLATESHDIAPLRALSSLRSLTLKGGPAALDLSPINTLPVESLECSARQALRNRVVLEGMTQLKTINGEPKRHYLETLRQPAPRASGD